MIDSITLLRAQEAGLPAAESHPDPPLVSFPLRADWDMTRVAEREMWPDALLDSHEVGPEFMGKRAVMDMVKLATAHGWLTQVTHARGCYPSLGGHPGPPKHSLAVRLRRGPDRAVAVYVEAASAWAWKTLYRWETGTWPHGVETVEAFLVAITGPLCKPAWPTDWTCPHFGPVHGPIKAPKR